MNWYLKFIEHYRKNTFYEPMFPVFFTADGTWTTWEPWVCVDVAANQATRGRGCPKESYLSPQLCIVNSTQSQELFCESKCIALLRGMPNPWCSKSLFS